MESSESSEAAPSNELLTQVPTPQVVTLVESLEHPWGLTWLPDGTMLVTERPGRVRIIKDGVLDPTPVSGLPEVLARGQGGLMDVSVHPQFAENQWVYFTYADGTGSANRTRVARARFDGSDLSDWQVIFEVNRTKEGTQHFGSRLVWMPDSTLLVSIGDGGNPPVELEGDLIRNQAQNLGSHLGSLVRINDDGSPPANNPFVDTANADPAIWSYGHRNIQGVAIDSVTGQVWATEHGSKGGDELNLIAAGENYGWPIVTHSREYSGGEISSERSRPGMVDPLIVWTPSIAPSGLAVYRGDRVPQWQGDLFAGGLVSQSIQHIKLDASGAVLSQTPIDIGQRVRDVAQGPDGWIYVLTDEPNGRLVRLEPG
ncbi:PQQ-dependent sugar dehydrogenase [Leptolyngbya sp. BC1307]|uniref:PQQ-dependent sugar dehydrogenase n=1 Tax=Leptolyngbya sp. BC1307 TaxID=2029589 RepID=UPI0032049CE6